VETLDAFAITDAKKDDAFAGSIADAESTSFMSYLKGASFWVFSMDCLLFTAFGFGFGFLLLFWFPDAGLYCVGGFLPAPSFMSANAIAPELLLFYII